MYALGFVVSFLYFEIGSLKEDVAQIGGLFNGGAIAFLIEFFIDSFTNTVRALGWPIYVVSFAPPWGAIGLGVAFAGFTTFLKPPITRWMFPDGEPEEE